MTNQAVLYMGARPWCPGSSLRGPRQQPASREPHRHHQVIAPTLAEAGIDKKLSSRAKKLAGVPETVCLGSPRTRETALAGVRGASRRGFAHLWIRGAAVAVKQIPAGRAPKKHGLIGNESCCGGGPGLP